MAVFLMAVPAFAAFVKLNDPLPPFGNVDNFVISPDNSAAPLWSTPKELKLRPEAEMGAPVISEREAAPSRARRAGARCGC
jgi:hypothetical protein